MDKVILNNKEYPVTIAITDEEQMRGLMYRTSPVPVMAFPFVQSKPTKFWMKNTYVPLDIIFCNAGKVISSYYGVPLSDKLVGPDRPTDLVVEFPAGMVKAEPGDRMELIYSVRTLARWYMDKRLIVSGS